MAEDTLVSFSVGLIVALLVGAVVFGVTWGRLTSRLTSFGEQISGLNKAINHMDRAARQEAHALGQRWHDAQAIFADHELRLALVERDLGIPQRLREDRTPVATMRRPRVDTGPHPTPDTDR